MHPMKPVELSGELVAIEPLSAEHAAGLLAAADAEEVFAWLPYPRLADLDQARAWIEEALSDRRADRRLSFAVLSAVDRAVVGSTSYWDFDAQNAHVEIGSTWLSRAAWGTGCNAEAKLLLMGHAFETLELERVAFRTDICNERSQRAIERLGAARRASIAMRCDDGTAAGATASTTQFSAPSGQWPKRAWFSDSLLQWRGHTCRLRRPESKSMPPQRYVALLCAIE